MFMVARAAAVAASAHGWSQVSGSATSFMPSPSPPCRGRRLSPRPSAPAPIAQRSSSGRKNSDGLVLRDDRGADREPGEVEQERRELVQRLPRVFCSRSAPRPRPPSPPVGSVGPSSPRTAYPAAGITEVRMLETTSTGEDVKALCSLWSCSETAEMSLREQVEQLQYVLASKQEGGGERRERLNPAKFLYPECPRTFWEDTGRSEREQVSVVIPVYNHASLLAAALRSVNESACSMWRRFCGAAGAEGAGGSAGAAGAGAEGAGGAGAAGAGAGGSGGVAAAGCFPVEVIVVDDASTDATSSRAAAFEQDCQRGACRLWLTVRTTRNHKRMGAAKSRNVGVDESRGRWIVFLDADDEMLPRHLLLLATAMATNTSLLAVRTRIELWDAEAGRSLKEETKPRWKEAIERGAPTNLIVRKDAHDCVGGFPAGLLVGEDFVYAQRIEELAAHVGGTLGRVEEETVRRSRRDGEGARGAERKGEGKLRMKCKAEEKEEEAVE
eukprot:767908-Hanusia_phi.AAC.3